MTTIYLIRHAESEPSKAIPEPKWPLSAVGRGQAEELIQVLDSLGIDTLYSSPYPRAIDTVRPFAEKRGIKINLVENFRERKLTEGMIDGFLEVLEKAWSDFDFSLPNCESSNECQRRFCSAFNQILTSENEKTIGIASHGNAIGLFINSLDGQFGFAEWKQIQNPDIFKFDIVGEQIRWDRQFSW